MPVTLKRTLTCPSCISAKCALEVRPECMHLCVGERDSRAIQRRLELLPRDLCVRVCVRECVSA